MKKNNVINVYDKLSDSKLSKMDGNGKFKIIKIILELDKVNSEYKKLVEETVKRLKPAWLEGEKAIEWDKNNINSEILTQEEKTEIINYINSINQLLSEELNKEITLESSKLTEEEWKQFIESNDFTPRELINFSEILYEADKK